MSEQDYGTPPRRAPSGGSGVSRPGPLEPSIFVVIPGASTVPVTVSAFYVDHDAGALVFRNRNGLATEVWAAGTWKRVRSAD